MVLATRCSRCGTVFRVVADQLKLRGGLVRCGVCSHVFDGNASLVDAATLEAQGIPFGGGVTTQPADSADRAPSEPSSAVVFESQAVAPPEPTLPVSPGDSLPVTPGDDLPEVIRKRGERWSAYTGVNDPAEIEAETQAEIASAAAQTPEPTSIPASTSPVVDTWESVPEVDPSQTDEEWRATPLFADDRRPAASEAWHSGLPAVGEETSPRSSHRLIWLLAVLIALLALAGQAVWMFRDDIATYMPSARPLLEKACAALTCRVEYLRDPKRLSIESSSLEPRNAAGVSDAAMSSDPAVVGAAPAAGIASGDAEPFAAAPPAAINPDAARSSLPPPIAASFNSATALSSSSGLLPAGSAAAATPTVAPSTDPNTDSTAAPAAAGDHAASADQAAPSHLILDVVVRNRARFPQPWPAVEIALTDFSQEVVARKVVLPAAYLAPELLSKPLQAGEERTLRIPIDTQHVLATGYRVALFFP